MERWMVLHRQDHTYLSKHMWFLYLSKCLIKNAQASHSLAIVFANGMDVNEDPDQN